MMFGGLLPHARYVPTGIPWCPEAPSHWSLRRNKNVMRRVAEPVGTDSSDYKLLSLTKGGVIARDPDNLKGKMPASFDTYQRLNSGDLVMCLFDVDETPRTVGIARESGMITSAYDRYVVDDAVTAEFLAWFYIAVDNIKGLRPLYRGLRKTVPNDVFMATAVPIPPQDERAAIAKYLAHANARIDQAITAKWKLIVLLEEQMHTARYQAVTRGLSESVARGTATIPWLQGVPSNWTLVPARAVLRPSRSVVGSTHQRKTLLSLTLRGVIPRDMENAKGKFPSDFSTYQDVSAGQFVFCLFDVDETPRTVGLSREAGMVTGAYTVFDCPDQELADYLEQFYLAMDSVKAFRPLYTGLRKVIPKDAFLRVQVPLPPPTERQAIVSRLRSETSNAHGAIKKLQREISLLREFRIRLVTDVALGQTDVRSIAEALPESEVVSGWGASDIADSADLSDSDDVIDASED